MVPNWLSEISMYGTPETYSFASENQRWKLFVSRRVLFGACRSTLIHRGKVIIMWFYWDRTVMKVHYPLLQCLGRTQGSIWQTVSFRCTPYQRNSAGNASSTCSVQCNLSCLQSSMAKDHLAEWRETSQHPAFEGHPVLNSTPDVRNKMVPLAWRHVDATVIGIGKIWSRQLTIFL